MFKLKPRWTAMAVIALIGAIGVQSVLTPSASACTPEAFARKMKKAIAKGDIARVCELIVQFLRKIENTPLPPLDGMPSAATCAMTGTPISPEPGGGRGRGGGQSGGGSAGGSAGGQAWGFNSANSTNEFGYLVVPDPGNPPGFTVVNGSGTFMIPRGETASAPFSIDIAPGTPVGTESFFDVFITDLGNGLPVADDFQRIKVTVLDGLSVTISQTNFNVEDGALSTAKWKVKNLLPMARMIPYTFTMTPDPASEGKSNAGAAIPMPETFSAPRSAMGGGSVSLAAAGGTGDEQEIIWDMEPGEFCDPAMIGCCGLELGGVFVGDQCFVNTADVSARCCMPADLFLFRGATTGGTITVTIDTFAVNVAVGGGLNRLQTVDLVAAAVNNEWHITDGYNFTAVPLFEELIIMHKGGLPCTITSTDPGMRVVKLRGFPALDTFDVLEDAGTNDSTFHMTLENRPATIELEMRSMVLTSVNPIRVIQTQPESEWDVSKFFTSNSRMMMPMLNPGNFYGATAQFQLQTNIAPVQFAGPFQIDLSPLSPLDQAFNVIIPLTLGAPPQYQTELTLHVRPRGFNGPNEFPVQLMPPSITANPTAPGQFQISFQSQALNILEGVRHDILVTGGVQFAPAWCPTYMGDANQDLFVNGIDVQRFVNASLSNESAQTCPCADIDGDQVITPLDTPGFVSLLLN